MIGSAALAGVPLLRCPLCDGTGFAKLSESDDVPLVRCRGCGFMASETASSEESLYGAEFYAPAPSQRRRLAGRLFGRLEAAFLGRRAAVVSRLLPARGLRVTDVGCGIGGFLSALREVRPDLDLIGVEPSTAGAAVARQRELATTDRLPDPDKSGVRLDCVTLWHVLEHVQDLRGCLDRLHRLLSPGGFLVVAVPNIDSLGFRLFGGHWGFLDPARHYWHFAPETLEALVVRHGFQPVGNPSTLFEYEFPITVLSLMNVLSGKDRMLFYNVVKKDRSVPLGQRVKMLGLGAALPFVAAMAVLLDAAAAIRGKPNNTLRIFQKIGEA